MREQDPCRRCDACVHTSQQFDTRDAQRAHALKMGSMTSTPDALWPAARVRGSLALVAGRGERTPVYERFGRRLSADGYTVAVFEGDADRAVEWLRTADGPRVLVGSDTGAAAVLRELTKADVADGAIVAGLPLDAGTDAPSDAQRTACPLHLGVLAENAQTATPVPAQPTDAPAAADLAAVAVPVLAFHGTADDVAPIDETRELLAALPDLEFVETVDGLHDALNDRSHRSVAATIVLWLERLREGDVHAPVVRAAQAVRA